MLARYFLYACALLSLLRVIFSMLARYFLYACALLFSMLARYFLYACALLSPSCALLDGSPPPQGAQASLLPEGGVRSGIAAAFAHTHPYISYSLSQRGADVEPTWSRRGANMGDNVGPTMWSQRGANVEPTWSQSGTNLEPTWSQRGANLEPTWSQRGAMFEPTFG
jgi:hypothetical protein